MCRGSELNTKNPNKHITFNCDSCGKETEQKQSEYIKNKKHYCSRECFNQGMKKSIDVSCSICGKSFFIIQSKFDKSKTKLFYCSKNCYLSKSEKIETKCKNCGKQLIKNKSSKNKTGLYFCDKNCHNQWQARLGKFVSCAFCGNEIYKSYSNIKINKTDTFFCNKKCKESFDSIRLTKLNKEDNPSKYKIKKKNLNNT